MKKGELSIQYIFIIFLSTITVFVIIGMLTGWKFQIDRFMCKLTGECDTSIDPGKETITTDTQSRFHNEIVKHAKLCHEYAKTGKLNGELCYTIKCVSPGCTQSCSQAMMDEIDRSICAPDLDCADCSDFQNSDKAIIRFDYGISKVVIE